MSETGTERPENEAVPTRTPPAIGTDTAPDAAQSVAVVAQTAPTQAQPKRAGTQRQLDALAAARVTRSAKAAARKAEHARLSEQITVEHSDSDEDVEYVIKRVRRLTAKSQDGGGEGKCAPTTAPVKEKRKQVAVEPPPQARDSSSESEDEPPARQRSAPVESAHEIIFV